MTTKVLNNAAKFIDSLPKDDIAKITANLKSLEADYTAGLAIKSLKGKIKEMVVGQYRIIFFRINTVRYIISIFRKQSQKTPHRIIEQAEKVYRYIINN